MNAECSISQATTLEFDVNLTCENCSIAVKNALKNLEQVKSIQINVEKQSVLVETSLPSQDIKEAIENTGKKAVLKGSGLLGSSHLGAAVAEIKINPVFGVIRFHQVHKDLCIIDGTVDGLRPGEHDLQIHEFGDISGGSKNLGPVFHPLVCQDTERVYGNLGKIKADEKGRSNFRKEDGMVKVWDIIGRSITINSNGKNVAYAIIARSAGLFQNPKRFCQCDGIGIWDEEKPTQSF